MPAEPGADRERLVEQHLRRSASGSQLAADLGDRERIALRPGRDLAGDPAVQRDVARGGQQQLYGVIQVQGRHGQVGDAGEDDFRRLVLAGGEQHEDALVSQPPRHEGEHLSGLCVQPVGVVDEADEQPRARQVAEQRQHGQAEQERGGFCVAAVNAPVDAQARVQGATLSGRENAAPVRMKKQQTVQPGQADG